MQGSALGAVRGHVPGLAVHPADGGQGHVQRRRREPALGAAGQVDGDGAGMGRQGGQALGAASGVD
ncbi:MAG: hypothetical protein ACRYHQ_36475, partial [Janthinobacterium lividum]